MNKNPDRYLERRGQVWYYIRRAPRRISHLLPKKRVLKTLSTKDLEEARLRRDVINKDIEESWGRLAFYGKKAKRSHSGEDDYQLARSRCELTGHDYQTMAEQLEHNDLVDLLSRLETLRSTDLDEKTSRAIFGLVTPPNHSLADALNLYVKTIAPHETRSKSEDQRLKWLEARQRSISRFEKVCGQVTLSEITRAHAVKFYSYWRDRVIPEDAQYKPNTANKQLGHLRKIYRLYWTYHGEEDRPNPFRNLSFSFHHETTTPVFTDEWVKTKFLGKNALAGLNREAQIVVPVLIETGCRLSEIVNLIPENICLKHQVPHIRIRPTARRELKTPSSKRDIPLVGVALDAMKQVPNGFPRYADNATALSNLLNKALRARGLFPSTEHRIYSFRHSFEKRMLEAGLDYGLRCTLMGHKNSRPQYGDGGSLSFRKDELTKIAHPNTCAERSQFVVKTTPQ